MRKETKAYRAEARRIRRAYEKTAKQRCSTCISNADLDHCPAWDSYCDVRSKYESLDAACDVNDSDIDKPWCKALMEHIRGIIVATCLVIFGIVCYICSHTF
jgi:hypothetical protein